jgi:hypothetical protein
MAPTRGHFVALISPQEGDQCVDARPGRGRLWTLQTIVLSKGSETTPNHDHPGPRRGTETTPSRVKGV